MPFSEDVLDQEQELPPALYEIVVAVARATADERLADLSVTRQDFEGVRTDLHDLAAVQSRMDESLQRLAEAQARTDESLQRLAEAQARTDESLHRLAEAQARTEVALQNLTRQVGGLSETVGGDIEDIAYIVLHDVLKREFGWQVGLLERTWMNLNGQLEEVNVFGSASDPARPDHRIWIFGEAKHNITLKEVERFIRQVERARMHLEGELFPVCFCYRARPEVQQRIRDAGLRLVFSYGKLV